MAFPIIKFKLNQREKDFLKNNFKRMCGASFKRIPGAVTADTDWLALGYQQTVSCLF